MPSAPHTEREAIISAAGVLCVYHHKRKCSSRRIACLWHGDVQWSKMEQSMSEGSNTKPLILKVYEFTVWLKHRRSFSLCVALKNAVTTTCSCWWQNKVCFKTLPEREDAPETGENRNCRLCSQTQRHSSWPGRRDWQQRRSVCLPAAHNLLHQHHCWLLVLQTNRRKNCLL